MSVEENADFNKRFFADPRRRKLLEDISSTLPEGVDSAFQLKNLAELAEQGQTAENKIPLAKKIWTTRETDKAHGKSGCPDKN